MKPTNTPFRYLTTYAQERDIYTQRSQLKNSSQKLSENIASIKESLSNINQLSTQNLPSDTIQLIRYIENRNEFKNTTYAPICFYLGIIYNQNRTGIRTTLPVYAECNFKLIFVWNFDNRQRFGERSKKLLKWKELEKSFYYDFHRWVRLRLNPVQEMIGLSI